MKYLLDASALLPLITTHGKQLITEASRQNLFTIDLAIYEACNTLWKLSTLLKSITPNDAENVATTLKDVITHGMIQSINYAELDLLSTLRLAHQRNLTFYDTSYIVTAKNAEAIFVTDDEKLRKIAKKYVKATTYTDFERKLTTELQEK